MAHRLSFSLSGTDPSAPITTGLTFVLRRHFFELLSLGPGTFRFFIYFHCYCYCYCYCCCSYFCFAFPGIAASRSGDTGLRIEEWWEMFKNVGEKTNKRANG